MEIIPKKYVTMNQYFRRKYYIVFIKYYNKNLLIELYVL